MEDELEKYNKWNEKKKDIQKSTISQNIYFKEGDVWWSSIGLNIGTESFGKGEFFRRPIIILKKLSSELYIAVLLTSKFKQGTWFADITINNDSRCAMVYQIRTLHRKRLQHKIGHLDHDNFSKVKEKLEALLELSQNHHSTDVEIEGYIPKVDILYAEWEIYARSIDS